MLLVAWLSFLLASMSFLARGGGGPLGGPPLLHPGSVGTWIRRCMQAGPSPAVGAGFAALRLLAVALCGYLLVVTLASLLAHVSGWSRAAGLADRRGPRIVHALVRSSLGLTLSTAGLAARVPVSGAASLVAVASGPAHQGSRQAPLQASVRVRASKETTETTAKAPVLEWVGPPAHSPHAHSRLGVGPGASATGRSAPRSPSSATAPPAGPTLPTAGGPTTWTVGPGDSFWSIATAVLQTAWGRAPTDAEVEPYWLTLIAANRRVLLHPDVPDLLYTGQELVVPAPPAPPGGSG